MDLGTAIDKLLDQLMVEELEAGMDRLAGEEKSATAYDVVFQPGNGTRYEVVITKLGSFDFVMSWIRGTGGGKTHRFTDYGGVLHYSYFMEKMGMQNMADAHALLLLLRELDIREVILPSEGGETGYELPREQDDADVAG